MVGATVGVAEVTVGVDTVAAVGVDMAAVAGVTVVVAEDIPARTTEVVEVTRTLDGDQINDNHPHHPEEVVIVGAHRNHGFHLQNRTESTMGVAEGGVNQHQLVPHTTTMVGVHHPGEAEAEAEAMGDIPLNSPLPAGILTQDRRHHPTRPTMGGDQEEDRVTRGRRSHRTITGTVDGVQGEDPAIHDLHHHPTTIMDGAQTKMHHHHPLNKAEADGANKVRMKMRWSIRWTPSTIHQQLGQNPIPT